MPDSSSVQKELLDAVKRGNVAKVSLLACW